MDKKVELIRLPNMESANEIIFELEAKNIEFNIEESRSGYNFGVNMDSLDDHVSILVNETDMSNIMSNEILRDKLAVDLPSHYLYTLSNDDLLEIIDNPVDLSVEEIELATEIATKRSLQIKEDAKEKLHNFLNNTNDSEDDLVFPEKPVAKEKKESIYKSIMSLGLFVGAFYIFFNQDISFVLILTAVLFIHEMGHFIAMKLYGYKNLKIFFIPLLGAATSGEKEGLSQRQELVMLLAGPLPGFIIGLILLSYGYEESNSLMVTASLIFILLNIFNLLPITPLDGGRILKVLFFNSNKIINNVFIVLSALALTIISIKTETWILLIIPVVLIIQLRSQIKFAKYQAWFVNAGFILNKTYDELTDKEYWMMREFILRGSSKLQEIANPGEFVISEEEDKFIERVKSLIEKEPIQDISLAGKILVPLLLVTVFLISLTVIPIQIF